MGDGCGMSISADSPSDETLNRGPLALLLRRQYEFPYGINIVLFSIFPLQYKNDLVCADVEVKSVGVDVQDRNDLKVIVKVFICNPEQPPNVIQEIIKKGM